jgi:predicted dehydrogenase/threonine dehydrogenase-like Zn-dependent dehydrogenase
MKQVLEDFNTGVCRVEDVPAPVVRPGFVLIRNRYSLISSGTEGGTVKLGQMSMIGKARARPEQVRKVLRVVETQGLLTAIEVTRNAIAMPIVLGYCTAGQVLAVGEGVTGVVPGQEVACGGSGYANHAEVVLIPHNLCLPVPAGVSPRAACFTTLGAIALQSLRVADCRLGESVTVIGLGLVGLLTVQLLRAAGCRVFGIDVDPLRVAFAAERGYCPGGSPTDANIEELVRAHAGGQGADAVIITAATSDNSPAELAGRLCRIKGRVVAVGRTEYTLPRDTYLFKELSFLTSMAYGPGTGDPTYEEGGLDYPYPYCRWTEGRNMGAFLDCLASGGVDTEALITHDFPIDEAGRAFDLIGSKAPERSTAILLRYPEVPAGTPQAEAWRGERIALPAARPRASGTLGIGVIGAGSFATNEFLPLLAQAQGISLRGIASATGHRAASLGKRYGFAVASADPEAILGDPETDCVFLLTRHDSHAPLAVAALKAGKHVFVEKPLALTEEDLEAVIAAQRESGRLVMVGFNRRYAPLALRLKAAFTPRAQPLVVIYRANVGYRPPSHWLHDPIQGGGVILGEACHHIDFCNFMVGSGPVAVRAERLGGAGTGVLPEDNALITLRYGDGSLATVAYLSNGSKSFPAEQVEIYGDNKTGAITDYRTLQIASGTNVAKSRLWLKGDKGHRAQIDAFLAAARGPASGQGGGQAAGEIDMAGYFASSRATLEAARQVRTPA